MSLQDESILEQENGAVVTDAERIQARYEVIRDLDVKLFNTRMAIRDAQNRVTSILSEIKVLEEHVDMLNEKREEEIKLVAQISERKANFRI